jgi:hypothetical protein
MEHSYFQDRLSAYYDNELPLQEKVVVDEHVKGCEECRRLLEKYERLDDLVNTHGQLGDTDYWERSAKEIDRAIDRQQEDKIISVSVARRKFDLGWKLAAVAATLVLVGYIGIHKDDIFTPEKIMPPSVAPRIMLPDKAKEATSSEADTPAQTRQKLADSSAPGEARKTDMGGTGQVGSVLEKDQRSNYKTEPGRAKDNELHHDMNAPTPLRQGSSLQSAQVAPAEAVPSLDKAETGSVQPQAVAVVVEQKPDLSSTIDTGLGLTYWRAMRDSLQPKGVDSKRLALAEKLRATVTSSLRKPDANTQSAALVSDTVKSSSRLIEAWYQIARLSNDSTEKGLARAVLETIAKGEAGQDRDRAQAYLDSLVKK